MAKNEVMPATLAGAATVAGSFSPKPANGCRIGSVACNHWSSDIAG
jgi:hypothetical protein